jgi:calmodulin
MADIEQYRATFELVDVDGDGFLSAAEFRNLMRALGQEISHARSVEVVVAADRNGDGKISLPEFAEFMASHLQ